LKSILQIFILFFFYFNNLEAVDFTQMKDITLKKDQMQKILVVYSNKEKVLKFRWTLFINNGLVIFRSYDRIVAQNILYQRYKNRSFRVELKTRGMDMYNVPYVLIRFKEFKYDTNEAVFELLLSDASSAVQLKYLN
jgi:hypothetical protein